MKAIHKLYPEAAKSKWKSDTEMYAWDKDGNEIELDLDAINNWVDPEEYKYKRQQEYKPLAEQLDMQYHDVQDGTETWLDHIKEVKAKYPKGNK
jgi:hypothetical protein